MRRRTFFKLAAPGLSIALCVGLVEGAVRLFGLAPALPEQYADYVGDPYRPYVRKSNVIRRGKSRSGEYAYEYRHNSRGFRDDEHALTKPDGVFRILGLGDSFTWGVGADYEKTYLSRLERQLNDRRGNGKTFEIIKAGVPRYFPEIQRLQLEHYGIEYEPDLIIAAFTWNDVVDTVRGMDALKPISKDGYLVSKEGARLGSTGAWLYLHWHTARIVLPALRTAAYWPPWGRLVRCLPSLIEFRLRFSQP